MKHSALLSLLTASLSSSTSADLEDRFTTWAAKHVPLLISKGQSLYSGFNLAALQGLAGSAVVAAQEFKDVLAGAQRVKVAQIVLVYAVKQVTPDGVEPWLLPFLEGPGLEAIIESAFLHLFPEKAKATPVVNAPELPEGGIQ